MGVGVLVFLGIIFLIAAISKSTKTIGILFVICGIITIIIMLIEWVMYKEDIIQFLLSMPPNNLGKMREPGGLFFGIAEICIGLWLLLFKNTEKNKRL
jgi:glucan phosphoethanolaminetransferase (alkaline phosphatase superfamily)